MPVLTTANGGPRDPVNGSGAAADPGIPAPEELTLAGLARLGPGSVCDEEPIHLSGSIQPYGFLLGADPETSVIRVASANLVDHIGVEAADALGSTLARVLGPAADRVPPLTTVHPDLRPDPLPLELAHNLRYDVATHRSGDLVLLEFERFPDFTQTFTTFHEALRRALDPVLATTDVATVSGACADQIRTLTGFDRVLVYRFDRDAHGVVVAESVAAEAMDESLLGIHFPAGDIPRQARALFLRKRLRMITDVGYEPVPLLALPPSSATGGTTADTGAAADTGDTPATDAGTPVGTGPGAHELDLTLSELRSVSPLHLEYLHGMGVAATMSVSIICGNRLWGMVLCHHLTPKHVPRAVRDVCETLTRTLSLQLDVERSRAGRAQAALRAQLIGEVVDLLGRPDPLDDIVANAALSLTGLVGADGVLVRLDGQIASSGDLVDPAEVAGFVAGVADIAGGKVWNTPRLSELMPTTGSGRSVPVAGVLVLPLPGDGDDLVIWVRREQTERVSWAGATPDEHPASGGRGRDQQAVEQAHRERTFTPRVEDAAGRSRRWGAGEVAAARELGDALPEALLRRTRRLLAEADAGSRAERAASTQTRERLERDLQRKLRLESLGKLAGGVAHDFNNLLSVILSHAEFVEEAVATIPNEVGGDHWDEVTSDTRQITLATQRAALLTRQLLSFARREVTQPRPLDLNQVITDLEMLLRRTLGQHIDLRLHLTTDPTTVLADPEQLERVLINLAVNARDAMPSGGTLTVTTETTAIATAPATATGGAAPEQPSSGEEPGAYVRLRVGDTGTGISQEVLDRVFDPFFTTKADGEGSGLGLATVHGIVSQAGGRVTIESEIGVGTTVSVLLPATARVAQPATAAPEQPAAAPAAAGTRTILLVEDETAIREVTRRILAGTGYQVLTAATGPDAVAVAAEFAGTIDLLLTDVVMPGMLGREVATRIRAARPEIAVLFMSGFAHASAAENGAIEPGAVLIDKPFTRAQLLTRLAEFV